MNAKNAEQQGRADGYAYLAFGTTKQEYEQHARFVVSHLTSYVKTQELYIKGFMSAWEEPKPAPVVEHFESRFDFCTCEACNAKRASL